MLRQYLLFLLQCINMMGKHLLRTSLDVLFHYLDQPCLSNAWVDNCLACSNLAWFYVGYDNATQFCVGYVNVKTRTSMV
jgi:hypothetical protein